MYGNNALNAYKNNSVNHASKEQLLLMLVDGAVRFAKIAREALINKDIKNSHENLIKTQNIFTELMVSLDPNAGEWAIQILKVYKYINEKLAEANIKKDYKILDEVMPLIEEVRSIWYDANKKSVMG
ncbi:flagellar export chaperone FliS [Clostridium gasigenes]|uniref:Flagellar secretion chaperone FliS n=1 Tax=Clostridium gasigenes TaxID=94869 RepID=A0A7X0RA13_9CLOT|nr:flagellar export chaperone FliS [Clostridium gasigenes]MBB6624471.1 flagellar export chaperone FliS [Clostridium gasigenes]MBB6715955.1 flagellar export chaperone FliS [Clostridium gasigenes]MBU3088634.1 flagellar export chaperone FliS [Clostridium gasigenes]